MLLDNNVVHKTELFRYTVKTFELTSIMNVYGNYKQLSHIEKLTP